MELIVIAVLAVLMPIMTIAAFIIGYNMNAPKKIKVVPKKEKEREMTEDEKMLERIDKARV